MNKLQQFKNNLKSPPPQRLAKVEYQSHIMNIFGVTLTSIILIAKGYWYVIFAFIFSIGSSYTLAMGAYQKYNMIMLALGKPRPESFDSDISPSRRRSNINQFVLGKYAFWISSFYACGITLLIINPIGKGLSWAISHWYLELAMFMMIIAIYIIFYFFILYWICYPIYKKRMKGGKENV